MRPDTSIENLQHQIIKKLRKKSRSIPRISVTTAKPVDPLQMEAALKEMLQEDQLIIDQTIEPGCLGGARIQFEDHVYDFTVLRQIESLKNSLLSPHFI